MDDDKVIGIHGGPLMDDPSGLPDQLYRARDVLDRVPDDLHRVVVVGEDLEGNLYVSSTHHNGFASHLLGKAQHMIHSRYNLK